MNKKANAKARGAPMELKGPNGLTVRRLIRLLETANPNAHVILRPKNAGWQRCRRVALEVHNFGGKMKATVDFF